MKKHFLLLPAAALALAACSNNDNDNYVDEPVAAQVSATISNSAVSRASNDSWDQGDEIGITMGDRYKNIKYTTPEGDGMFTGTTLYFKNKLEPVTLTAYYPFAGTEGTAQEIIEASTTGVNQTPETQSSVDFLHAVLENVIGSNPNVQFSFSHKMGKISFLFISGNDGTDVSEIVSYQVDGLVLDGTFNTTTGVCAVSDAEASPLSIDMSDTEMTDDDTVVSSLIVFPQSTGDKTVKLKITDSDAQNYACELKFSDDRISSGNNYQFTIKVNKTGLTVNESGITDWNTIASPDPVDADAVGPDPEE